MTAAAEMNELENRLCEICDTVRRDAGSCTIKRSLICTSVVGAGTHESASRKAMAALGRKRGDQRSDLFRSKHTGQVRSRHVFGIASKASEHAAI